MTRTYAEKAFAVWRERLGLRHWDVSFDFEEPAQEDADTSTWLADNYDRATVHLSPEWKSWDKLKLNRLLVHELLHLFTRDVDRVIDDLEGQLHRDVYELVDKRYHHETEGFVDRLAYRIVDMAGVV